MPNLTNNLPKGFWYDSLDSTQNEAKRLIQAGQIQGTAFVVADHQTQGRGTHGREWISPENAGIYLSVIHMPPPKETFEMTTLYTLSAGVACIEALQLTTGIEARLKPVNDIYVNGKKLGGILVESELRQDGMTALITGIGINTHHVDRNLDIPISLEELLLPEAFLQFKSEALIEALVAKVCFWHGLVMTGNTGQVEKAWTQFCSGDTGLTEATILGLSPR